MSLEATLLHAKILEAARSYDYTLIDRGVARRMRWEYGQVVSSELPPPEKEQ